MLYKDEAIVLRSMRLSDADRIVTFAGREHGKIRAVAKGIRRTKSRFGARLEAFSRVSLVLWKGKSDLHTVTQVQVLESFRNIREDLDRFAIGQVMLEACDRVVQEQQDSAPAYDLLAGALRRLGNRGSSLVAAGFLLRLCAEAGFEPALSRCAQCSGKPEWFSPAQGGAVCRNCRGPGAEKAGPSVLALMDGLARSSNWPGDEIVAGPLVVDAVGLSQRFAEYYLERRFKAAKTAVDLARLVPS